MWIPLTSDSSFRSKIGFQLGKSQNYQSCKAISLCIPQCLGVNEIEAHVELANSEKRNDSKGVEMPRIDRKLIVYSWCDSIKSNSSAVDVAIKRRLKIDILKVDMYMPYSKITCFLSCTCVFFWEIFSLIAKEEKICILRKSKKTIVSQNLRE